MEGFTISTLKTAKNTPSAAASQEMEKKQSGERGAEIPGNLQQRRKKKSPRKMNSPQRKRVASPRAFSFGKNRTQVEGSTHPRKLLSMSKNKKDSEVYSSKMIAVAEFRSQADHFVSAKERKFIRSAHKVLTAKKLDGKEHLIFEHEASSSQGSARKKKIKEYKLQGDKKFYTSDALSARERIFSSPLLNGQIKMFWKAFKKSADGTISQREYIRTHVLMFKALDPKFRRDHSFVNAMTDWKRDMEGEDLIEVPRELLSKGAQQVGDGGKITRSRRRSVYAKLTSKDRSQSSSSLLEKTRYRDSNMSFLKFRRSFFELADQWTDSIDEMDYAKFLFRLLARITVTCSNASPVGPRTWKSLAEVSPLSHKEIIAPLNKIEEDMIRKCSWDPSKRFQQRKGRSQLRRSWSVQPGIRAALSISTAASQHSVVRSGPDLATLLADMENISSDKQTISALQEDELVSGSHLPLGERAGRSDSQTGKSGVGATRSKSMGLPKLSSRKSKLNLGRLRSAAGLRRQGTPRLKNRDLTDLLRIKTHSSSPRNSLDTFASQTDARGRRYSGSSDKVVRARRSGRSAPPRSPISISLPSLEVFKQDSTSATDNLFNRTFDDPLTPVPGSPDGPKDNFSFGKLES